MSSIKENKRIARRFLELIGEHKVWLQWVAANIAGFLVTFVLLETQAFSSLSCS